jgi:hypothetical protein
MLPFLCSLGFYYYRYVPKVDYLFELTVDLELPR